MRHWAVTLSVLILAAISAVCEGVAIASLIPLLELAIGTDAEPSAATAMSQGLADAMSVTLSVPLVLGVLVLFGVLSAFLKYGFAILQVRLGNRIEIECQQRLYSAIMSTRWSIVSQVKGGELLKGVLGDPAQIRVGFLGLVAATTSSLEAFIYLVLALLLSFKLTLLVGLFVAVTLVPYLWFLRRGARAGRRFNVAWRDLYADLTDMLSNLKLIFSQGLRPYAVQEAEVLFDHVQRERLAKERENLRSRLVFEGAGMLFISFVLYAQLVILQESAATGLVFLAVFSRLAPRLATVQTNYFGAVSQTPFLLDWGERCGEYASKIADGGGTVSPVFEQEIRVENVSYTYSGHSTPALAQTSLVIPRKGTIALTAPSGHGKTTLLGVLCGLLTPQHGQVIVDGMPLNKLDMQAWQSRIGLVLQDNPMFHASLRENIAWGSEHDVDDDRILEVCRIAGVLDFIEQIPDGLDTVIGDQGSRLSGGQRQRLALARALYRKPSLLLLDEPTSALDEKNEQKLIESLRGVQGKIAMVIVSHRGAILSLADTVYELG